MSTKKKSDAIKFLENLTGGPLTFSEVLESTRLCEEMNQTLFAKKLGISRSHLCDIEKGRKTVSPVRAARWAKKLGYSERQWAELALQALLTTTGLHYHVILQDTQAYTARL